MSAYNPEVSKSEIESMKLISDELHKLSPESQRRVLDLVNSYAEDDMKKQLGMVRYMVRSLLVIGIMQKGAELWERSYAR